MVVESTWTSLRLIFVPVSFTTKKPLPKGFSVNPTSIGEHIRKLGLRGLDVAEVIGVTGDTITNWELNRNKIRISKMPKVIEYLGFQYSGKPKFLCTTKGL